MVLKASILLTTLLYLLLSIILQAAHHHKDLHSTFCFFNISPSAAMLVHA